VIYLYLIFWLVGAPLLGLGLLMLLED